MGVHPTHHRVTFIFSTGIRNLVCTISGPLRRASLSMSQWTSRTLWPETRSFSLSDSWLGWTPNCHPGTCKAVRQIILDCISNESSASSFFWLYGPAGAGKTAILQAIAEYLCSISESDQNFGGQLFLFQRKARARSRPFSVLNNRISTRSESTWTTSTHQWHYGIKPYTSFKVNACAATNPYCRCFPISITPSTTFLSCYHRRIGWMSWQGDPTVDSPISMRNDHSSSITAPIFNWKSPWISYPIQSEHICSRAFSVASTTQCPTSLLTSRKYFLLSLNMKTSPLFFSFVSKMFQVPYNMTIGLEDDIIFLHVVELSLSLLLVLQYHHHSPTICCLERPSMTLSLDMHLWILNLADCTNYTLNAFQ